MSCTSLATSLADQIKSHEEWSWARREHNQRKLEKLASALANTLTPFGRRWLAEDTSQLRLSLASQKLHAELEAFVENKSPWGALRSKCCTLQRRRQHA